MDRKLVAWARAVKARSRSGMPPLWLFTDAARLSDPVAAVRRLPAGLCGVVFRHDDEPERAALGRAIARICRARRLMLSVAGDARLAAALHAGVHLRDGRRLPGPRVPALTGSAHGTADLVRGRRAGVRVIFLSPAFPTDSHAGAPALGPLRWGVLARRGGVAALGGVTGGTVRRLRRPACVAVGAIGALGA